MKVADDEREWHEVWPPFWVEAGTALVRVSVAATSPERADRARRLARVGAGYDERTGRVTVEVAGVEGPFRVRVQVPSLGLDTGWSHAHPPGDVALVDYRP
jgi:uncharacterized Zn finger protein